jgi:TPP-dependent pyruvate/acetoin dehydrogenase alpha subunit
VSLDQAIEYRDRLRAEIDDAFARAVEAPWPKPEAALQGVYANEGAA